MEAQPGWWDWDFCYDKVMKTVLFLKKKNQKDFYQLAAAHQGREREPGGHWEKSFLLLFSSEKRRLLPR
jgi:hypothetical protein